MLEIVLTGKVVFNNLYSNALYSNNTTSIELIEKGIICDGLKEQICKVYNEDVFNINVNELLTKLNNSNFLTKFFIQTSVKKTLKPYLININHKIDNDTLITTLEHILKYQLNRKYLNENNNFLKSLFGEKYEELSLNSLLMKEYYNNGIWNKNKGLQDVTNKFYEGSTLLQNGRLYFYQTGFFDNLEFNLGIVPYPTDGDPNVSLYLQPYEYENQNKEIIE